MHLIDTPTATRDGHFTEGDPLVPTPATVVSADWLNSVQEEIVNTLSAAKIVPDKANNAQLAAAISALILAQKIKLTDRVNLTDSTTAASATAVKTAYDDAQLKLPLAGGVMTGSIQINDPENVIGTAPSTNTERGLFLSDKNSVIMGGFDVIQRASDNAKYTQFYSKNSKGYITSIAAVTYEDGTRELVADSPLQINDIQIKQVVDGGNRVIVLSGARGKEEHSFRFSPDTGEAYMDGRVIHAKADTAGYADSANTANLANSANRLRRKDGVDTIWDWAGQAGQPLYVWGSNDGINMLVWNPANFSVAYANSAAMTYATPNAAFVGNDGHVPPGGTWIFVYMSEDMLLHGIYVAGGSYAGQNRGGIAVRLS